MSILIDFAFISGLVTILAPCIWPLLPIVLVSSTGGGKRKSLGISLGVVTSFGLFILGISYLVSAFHLDSNWLRLGSALILFFLGLTLLWPKFTTLLESYLSHVSSKISLSKSNDQGFKSGIITGFSLGILWSPCAGPILATIATLAATQRLNWQIILITFFYCLGTTIPLFFFSYAGGSLIQKSRIFNKYTVRVQQIFGLIIILTAFSIYTNYDKIIQTKLLDVFPAYSNFIYKLETQESVSRELNNLTGQNSLQPKPSTQSLQLSDDQDEKLLSDYGPAPEFVGINHWLNTDKPLTLADLKGKVVLVDFWTYTCINCIRTLPHVVSWYEKYKDKGFVVVGVHTPEFEFEKNTQNVQNALRQYNINYPVAQDNDYQTWSAYQNQYWPAEYLIDAPGQVRHVHFGESDYDLTERAIRQLLKDAGSLPDPTLDNKPDETPTGRLSPETYIGSARMQYHAGGKLSDGLQRLSLKENPPVDQFSLGGTWTIGPEFSQADDGAILLEHFKAGQVFLVMQPGDSGSGKVKIYLDGKLIENQFAGADVKDGMVTLDQDRLYRLVKLTDGPSDHLLKLEFLTPGVQVYAFTFGQ